MDKVQYNFIINNRPLSQTFGGQLEILFHDSWKLGDPYYIGQRSLAVTHSLTTNKLRGLSPQANYIDRATVACGRS
jgi:hypothetical protein